MTPSNRTCPVPACTQPVPRGANAIFCVDHFFMVPPKEAQWLSRWKTRMLRCEDAEERRYMAEQLDSYVSVQVRAILSTRAEARR